MALRERLKKQALDYSQKAVERLMSDEKRAGKVAAAIGTVQRGKKALDKTQADLMRALSLAPQADFKGLGKELAGLKRRLRDLDEKVDALLGGRE
jgi:hypothetical protein